VDHMTKELTQNEKPKEPFACIQSLGSV
jgi:hypothetical protein